MALNAFRGAGPIARQATARAGYVPQRDELVILRDPQGYRASADLAQAVNVALELNMPLLLTGEPGTGKTQLAYRVAAELGLAKPLRFDTKSSSQAAELFYTFDSVRHFAQAQLNSAQGRDAPEPAQFVRYAALGLAILLSKDPQDPQWDAVRRRYAGPDGGPVQSVVLIDEIDKAPRDFPNDLLNQIEDLEFSVPELGAPPVRASRQYAPIVIITSNSEKQLPEPFLRRCVYHHIEFPKDRAEVEEILGARLAGLQLDGDGYESAVQFFFQLRQESSGLAKKPSTSELLDWLRALARAGFDSAQPIDRQKETARHCLGSLIKTSEDRGAALRLLGN
jgi:MoxR-like ATPase